MRRHQALSALALFTVGSAGCSNTPSPTPSPPQETLGPIDDGEGAGATPPSFRVTEFTTTEGPTVTSRSISPSTIHRIAADRHGW